MARSVHSGLTEYDLATVQDANHLVPRSLVMVDLEQLCQRTARVQSNPELTNLVYLFHSPCSANAKKP